MRRLPTRPALSQETILRLAQRTSDITSDSNPTAKAQAVYTAARQAVWFQPITAALRSMAGLGERCMFCSGSESSQVEHFMPKATFPQMAMSWTNFLWSCGICNQSKGNSFPVSEPSLINPSLEDAWNFFFMDEYGNLTERWRPDLNDFDPRAHITIEILALDREALQHTRQRRLINLKQLVAGTLAHLAAGDMGLDEARIRLEEWVRDPFQPDVADYFLRGPGRTEAPFSELLAILA